MDNIGHSVDEWVWCVRDIDNRHIFCKLPWRSPVSIPKEIGVICLCSSCRRQCSSQKNVWFGVHIDCWSFLKFFLTESWWSSKFVSLWTFCLVGDCISSKISSEIKKNVYLKRFLKYFMQSLRIKSWEIYLNQFIVKYLEVFLKISEE